VVTTAHGTSNPAHWPQTAFEEVSMDRTREVHVHVNWTVDALTQNCDETFTLTAHGEEAFFSDTNIKYFSAPLSHSPG
jgi:hypothetical protein